jgi:hypothetical protein
MSINNKITQLIIKITHRSEQNDDEVSSCQKSKPKISLLQKRLLWCFVGIILLIGGYFWWRMPVRMRVVAVVQGDNINNGHGKAIWNPLGLYRLSKTSELSGVSTVSLYGWDGTELWSVQVIEKYTDVKITCSPDGHYVAICLNENKTYKVFSWHDGVLVGKAIFVEKQEVYPEFYINNSGRVWLYYQYSMRFYNIIAIDGEHIAYGRMPITFIGSGADDVLGMYRLHLYVNEDIIGEYQESSFQYWKLKVIDDKVLILNTEILKNYTFWFNGYGLIKDKNDNILDITGKILYHADSNWKSSIIPDVNRNMLFLKPTLSSKGNRKYRFVYLPSGQQWGMSTDKIIVPLCNTQNGKYILTFEIKAVEYSDFILDIVSKWSFLDNIINHQRGNAELSLYDSSGNKIANYQISIANPETEYGTCVISGINYRILGNFAISSDGLKVGLVCYREEGDKLYYVFMGR